MQLNQECSSASIIDSLTELNQAMAQNKDITAIAIKTTEQLDQFDKTFDRVRDSKTVINGITSMFSVIVPLTVVTTKNVSIVNDLLKKMAQTFSSIEQKRRKFQLPAKQISMFDALMAIVNIAIGSYCNYFEQEDQTLKYYGMRNNMY